MLCRPVRLRQVSVVKRAHGESIVNDDEEQPGTQARISALIAGPHGVNAAEDDEIVNGDGIPDDWLSSWYPETHMSQKMVIGAKRKAMERFKRMKVRTCCHQGIHGKGRRGEDDKHQVGDHKQRYRRTPNCQGSSCGARLQHWRQTWRVVCCSTRFDGHANRAFQGDDKM